MAGRILNILPVDRQSNQGIVDAARLPIRGRDGRVRDNRRVLDQTCDTARALRKRKQFQCLKEAPDSPLLESCSKPGAITPSSKLGHINLR